MTTEIPFTKMVAAGNDFVIVDTRRHPLGLLKAKWPKVAKVMCDRRRGVGADGLLVLEPSKIAHAKMRVFNPDGSEAEMCGNGARCVASYVKSGKAEGRRQKVEGSEDRVTIQTKAGLVSAEVHGSQVSMWMPDPKILDLDKHVTIDGKSHSLCFLDTGVPHAVLFVKDLDRQDVQGLGREIRYHQTFQPEGTNVDFVKLIDNRSVAVRTYERGVECETLACGTGAVAAAIASTLRPCIPGYVMREKTSKTSSVPLSRLARIQPNALHQVRGRALVRVRTRSGEMLEVRFDLLFPTGNWREPRTVDAILEGSSKNVFEGTFSWHAEAR